jgi:hypothetical protein
VSAGSKLGIVFMAAFLLYLAAHLAAAFARIS